MLGLSPLQVMPPIGPPRHSVAAAVPEPVGAGRRQCCCSYGDSGNCDPLRELALPLHVSMLASLVWHCRAERTRVEVMRGPQLPVSARKLSLSAARGNLPKPCRWRRRTGPVLGVVVCERLWFRAELVQSPGPVQDQQSYSTRTGVFGIGERGGTSRCAYGCRGKMST